jgi:PHD/YefM family antitoxin component YafN of YafNO toxin-antitoxin module
MLEPTPFRPPTSTPAAEFGEHIDEHLRRLTKAKSPTVLTKGGKPAAFVLSPGQYRAYADAVEELRTLQAVEAGEREIAAGRGLSLERFNAEVARMTRAKPRRG